MERTTENINDYAIFVCNLCKKEGMKHLSAAAVAKIIEYSSRLSGRQDKLSSQFSNIADIIREANFYALREKKGTIGAPHILEAIDEKIYRSRLIEEKVHEMIEKGDVYIDVEGEVIGQVNGLSVMGLGDYMFGRPSRVTVSTGLGKGELIDIERESELGGSLHTKGVMILGGYLVGKYAYDKPLKLSARLVFEQSYGGVDGDSASSTELYALLSSLSKKPINQSIAVTGSVNQKGQVQPIGGVNEKIEGFFEVCNAIGLNGRQGVMIPRANVDNLMLNEKVKLAVEKGLFHIYAVSSIDEGIEILTGIKAGEMGKSGTYPKGTIHNLVDMRLREMAESYKSYSAL